MQIRPYACIHGIVVFDMNVHMTKEIISAVKILCIQGKMH